MGYTIKQGDTGYAIAQKHGISFEKLQRLNSEITDWSKIKPGQLINVKSPSSTNKPEYVKPGAYYLSYPSHEISLGGQIPGVKSTLPLGHAGVVIVGNDGSVTQYDYGRYSNKAIGSNINENEHEGNWTKTNRKKINLNSTTYPQLLRNVADTGPRASKNVRLTYAHDVDANKVVEYIHNDANDENRITYGIPLSAAKWDNLVSGDAPLIKRIQDLCTSKGCATSAYDAIQAGAPTSSKIKGSAKNFIMSSPILWAYRAAKELLSPSKDGVGADVAFSPRSRERRLQDQGYKTYDSNDY